MDKHLLMRPIRVHYENGDYTDTNINGTNTEIIRYYVGQYFEFDETKPSVKAVKESFWINKVY